MKHDPVNRPAHYTSHPSGVECITVAEHFGFNLGNVLKYIWRAEEKGAPLQDLEKAAWYLNREIERRRSAPTTEATWCPDCGSMEPSVKHATVPTRGDRLTLCEHAYHLTATEGSAS